jgi:hypothetical protein
VGIVAILSHLELTSWDEFQSSSEIVSRFESY